MYGTNVVPVTFVTVFVSGDAERFSIVSKVIARCVWFCITTLCDWLTKVAPLFQPMRSKTKTNRSSLHASLDAGCVHLL